MKPDNLVLKQAVEEIEKGEYTCLLIKDDRIIHRDNGRGVGPLLKLVDSDEGRELLEGAAVVDKIIGKAAAMISVLGGAVYVHGELMSAAGKSFLEERSIPYSFGKEVVAINNFAGDGICPIEKSVLDIDEPSEAFNKIKQTVEKLKKQ